MYEGNPNIRSSSHFLQQRTNLWASGMWQSRKEWNFIQTYVGHFVLLKVFKLIENCEDIVIVNYGLIKRVAVSDPILHLCHECISSAWVISMYFAPTLRILHFACDIHHLSAERWKDPINWIKWHTYGVKKIYNSFWLFSAQCKENHLFEKHSNIRTFMESVRTTPHL